MTDEALKLALEALEYRGVGSWRKKQPAITAIKQALANDALEKKAENARELGLDYEPEQEPDYSICPTCGGMALDPIVPKLERFTSPQGTWVELTDDEIKSLDLSNYVQVVRIVQAKLKEKNT